MMTETPPYISIVSPVYNAGSLVLKLVSEIKTQITKLTDNYEIILVEDGSKDNSWEQVVAASDSDKNIKAIKLSRNFGQHYAITAGLDFSRGDWVIVMDCDLQDNPVEFGNLYAKAQEGYEVVLARRIDRKDPKQKTLGSLLYYKLLSNLTGIKHDPAIANFGIYSRKVINVICRMREPVRFFPSMVKWSGFKSAFVDVQHKQRYEGKSNYNWSRLFRLGLDIILANSDKPVKLTIKIGFAISLISLIVGITILYRYFDGDIEVMGYTSLLLSIWFLFGATFMVLGIIGLYVGKTFEGVKQRPIYIVDETKNTGKKFAAR